MENGSCCLIQGDTISQVMPPLLILAFVLGALGNGIALCGFCFHMKTWKPSTIYLFNLAVADFLLMICLPFRTDYYRRHRQWAFEDIPCRVALFMLATNRAGSVVFLTVVAVDRYFKVVHPHHVVNAVSSRTAVGIVCALWAVVILGTLYLLMESHLCVQEKTITCESFIMESANGWHDVMFQLEFFLPLSIILFCSFKIIWSLKRRQHLARQTRMKKATRFIMVVAAVFITCYLPSVSARLYFLWTVPTSACNPFVHVALHVTLSFTYVNSMLDPLVYYFSSPSFPKFYSKLKIHSLRPKRPGHSKRPEEMSISNLCHKSCISVANSFQSQSDVQ
ncbi:hydroxycarboxylic acid receptor 1 [Physeter macrocephalus]|uniref:Hydroxycarboxylic acid receptor 1 n=1 Tax=Physeter macrocephalus TaxID=9755 RepID=A0A2Y9FUU3_PHYMC|nr:hydroxycarboxylic acid receptor 1 [Physeter catodon]|eukprot:XP_007131100.2 hydroxycarboxylic acid receptor 1 [Physeter catodon]